MVPPQTQVQAPVRSLDQRMEALKQAEEDKQVAKDHELGEKIGEIMTRTPEKEWAEPVSSIPARPRVLLNKENA